MNIGHAISTVLTIGTGRKLKPDQTDDSEQIGWGYGIAGILLLVVVQAGLFIATGLTVSEFRDLSIVQALALGSPFLIYLLAALLTRTAARLPAAFFYLGMVLAVVQLVSAIVQSFSSGSSFILGVTVVLVATGARGFFKLGWFGTVVVAILTLGAILGSAFILLYQLPTGQYLR